MVTLELHCRLLSDAPSPHCVTFTTTHRDFFGRHLSEAGAQAKVRAWDQRGAYELYKEFIQAALALRPLLPGQRLYGPYTVPCRAQVVAHSHSATSTASPGS